MKYYFIAGEASGDLHGANLIAATGLSPNTSGITKATAAITTPTVTTMTTITNTTAAITAAAIAIAAMIIRSIKTATDITIMVTNKFIKIIESAAIIPTTATTTTTIIIIVTIIIFRILFVLIIWL